MKAYIVRRNDAALMETHESREAAQRDMATRDIAHKWLTIVTADTHRVLRLDGYTYAVPKDFKVTVPTLDRS